MIKARNRKYYVLAGIIVFAILILAVAAFIMVPRGRPVELQRADALLGIVRDGDIICRLGDRFWSKYLKDMSVADKRYSHIGVARTSGGEITVIHVEGTTTLGKDHVKEEPLGDFIKIARAIGIYRVKDVEGSQISNTAMKLLGVPYDWQFDMHDESKIYCTELLHVIFKRVKPDLELRTVYVKELGKEIIPLEAISNSEYFSEIYYVAAD
jgi:hypothetical protein